MTEQFRQSGQPAGPLSPTVVAQGQPAIWVRCPGCRALIYHRHLVDALHVCSACGYHIRLSARAWIGLLDDGGFEEFDAELRPGDPLAFAPPGGSYADRLAREQRRTGEFDAVVSGLVHLDGFPLMIAACDFRFLGGSMGTVYGEKIARAAERAAAWDLPLLTINSSGGARMHEGMLSLMQMAKTCVALAQLARRGQLHISLLTDPCYGGVMASYATTADIVLAEPGARLGFAGRRVVAQTTGRTIADTAQNAEFMFEHGMIDRVTQRQDLRTLLASVMKVWNRRAPGCVRRARLGERSETRPAPPPPGLSDPAERLLAARNQARPRALDFIRRLCTSFVELHGDRRYGDDAAIVSGIAELAGRAVVVVAQQRGASARENLRRRFGMPRPEGYRKALRMFRLAEQLRLPLVTLIDTPGAAPDDEAEARGQATAIGECLMALATLRTPTVACILGEGTSGGGIALGMADRLLMLENATYTVISPEGCAAILWGDATRAPDALRALRATAHDAHALGIADEIIAEPSGGAHLGPTAVIDATGAALCRHLDSLQLPDLDTLVAQRYARYRSFGAPARAIADADLAQHAAARRRGPVHVNP